MFKTVIRILLFMLAAAAGGPTVAQDIIVIGHASLKRLDAPTVERIFTGRVIEVEGVSVTAVNAASGSAVRTQFLQRCLKQDEEKYTAYWTVRRYIGKGASPRELARSSDVISFVGSTPGGIGYINEAEVQPGINVLLKCSLGSIRTSSLSIAEHIALQLDKAISFLTAAW